MAQAEAVGHAGTWRLGHLSFLQAPCELGDFGAASLRHIVSLDCSGAAYLDDLAPLRSLLALERLTLRDCTSLSDIGPLGGSKRLTALDCTCCTAIVDVEALASCRWLRTLNLSFCRCGTRCSLPAAQPLRLRARIGPPAAPARTGPRLQRELARDSSSPVLPLRAWVWAGVSSTSARWHAARS